ncbi:MAG: hypothetical protein RMK29_00900 [Myxococcales bacterium]|nr:hypothetical protein [Myxococcota bacterium]MDW8280236.1 hypothetical protein [Myxococcales bacterium]
MHRSTLVASALALAAGAGLAVLLTPSRRIAHDRLLPQPAHLDATARALLRQRMARHGADMNELVAAVVLADLDEAQRRARSIAEDANLARPLSGDATELNSALPQAFFRFQDELRARARDLAAAAARRDAQATAAAFGQVASACVGCHLAYLGR